MTTVTKISAASACFDLRVLSDLRVPSDLRVLFDRRAGFDLMAKVGFLDALATIIAVKFL